MPSLPSTPSRVPSGHETKSSILYLHSLTVRPKDIFRLSGDPLIQDSLPGVGRTSSLSPRRRADETPPQSSAGSEFKGRHRAERVLNSEVPYIRYLIGRIVKTYDYINRVVLTLPLSVYEGTWTTLSPLVAMHHHDPVCA